MDDLRAHVKCAPVLGPRPDCRVCVGCVRLSVRYRKGRARHCQAPAWSFQAAETDVSKSTDHERSGYQADIAEQRWRQLRVAKDVRGIGTIDRPSARCCRWSASWVRRSAVTRLRPE